MPEINAVVILNVLNVTVRLSSIVYLALIQLTIYLTKLVWLIALPATLLTKMFANFAAMINF